MDIIDSIKRFLSKDNEKEKTTEIAMDNSAGNATGKATDIAASPAPAAAPKYPALGLTVEGYDLDKEIKYQVFSKSGDTVVRQISYTDRNLADEYCTNRNKLPGATSEYYYKAEMRFSDNITNISELDNNKRYLLLESGKEKSVMAISKYSNYSNYLADFEIDEVLTKLNGVDVKAAFVENNKIHYGFDYESNMKSHINDLIKGEAFSEMDCYPNAIAWVKEFKPQETTIRVSTEHDEITYTEYDNTRGKVVWNALHTKESIDKYSKLDTNVYKIIYDKKEAYNLYTKELSENLFYSKDPLESTKPFDYKMLFNERSVYVDSYDSDKGQTIHKFGDIKDKVVICNGYNTGLLISESANVPVVAVMDSSNMEAVAKSLSEKHGNNVNIYIISDNTPDAEKAASASNGKIITPQLNKQEIERGLTDFNDIAQSRGMFEVMSQIQNATSAKEKDAPQKTKEIEM